MTEREQKAAANRAAAPNVAKVVDEFKAVFGDVKVLWAIDTETGKVFGHPPERVMSEQRKN